MTDRGRCSVLSTSMADEMENHEEEENRLRSGSRDSPVISEDNLKSVEDELQEETEIKPSFSDGQLSYVGRDAACIPDELTKEFASKTKRLDLSFNCLRALNGLDQFTQLEELILDNNEIDDNVNFPRLTNLHTLTVNKNRIASLDRLLEIVMSQLPALTYLSLLGNTACPNQLSSFDKDEEDYQRYRYYVLYHLPQLKFLDSSQVQSSEVEEAKRVGPYMKVVRPNSDKSSGHDDITFAVPYSPLPDTNRQDGQHVGTYGVCKYVYYGRHSEGNRFIKNTDL